MPTATLDVDPDVYVSVGTKFLGANDAVCDIVASAAEAANRARGMAGIDSTGVAWAAAYDDAADALLRAGAAVVDALGVTGDQLQRSGANHDAADAASIPTGNGAAGPPSHVGSPGTGRAVGVVVSTPPSADGTPSDPPPGWSLIADLLAYVWPAGNPDQLRDVGTGWLTASLKLSEEADRLTGPLADLSGQSSPEVPYALATCSGLRETLRTVADQYAVVADVCHRYAGYLVQAHQDVVEELAVMLVEVAAIEAAGGLASIPTVGIAEVPTQTATVARIGVAAVRVGTALAKLVEGGSALRELIQGVAEYIVGVLLALREVTAERETLQAVTDLIDQGIPPVDLQANESANPLAHVIERHVAKSDAYLIGRTDQYVASTFTSLAAATSAISTVIAASRQLIADWLAAAEPELRLYGALPFGAGRTYLRRSNRFIVPTRLRVTLVRSSSGYYIVTAFPEP